MAHLLRNVEKIMNLLSKLVACTIAVGVYGFAQAETREVPPEISQFTSELRNGLKSVDAMKKMPIASISAVKVGKRLLFVSENGRFVWTHPPIDLWNAQTISSFEDTANLDRIDFSKLGVRFEEMPSLTFGTGKKEVVLFVDPYCSACHSTLKEMEGLASEYHFKIILYPVLGEPSVAMSRKLISMKNKDEAVKVLINQETSKVADVPQGGNLQMFQRVLLLGRLMNFQGVPVIVGPNGTVTNGLPQTGLKKFLIETDK
jgi:thiol:disulfide interchange protein DsbC